jgi:hypothetical protein
MSGAQAVAVLPAKGFAGKAEGYGTPLPQLINEVATLAGRVDEHLKKMGASWK